MVLSLKEETNMVLIKVPDGRVDEFLQKFFDESALTFEGLTITDSNSNHELEKALIEYGYDQDEVICYWFKGSVMNDKFNLTGLNRYPDELTFAVIPDFHNPLFKLLVGARWFDDIVQNNFYREAGIEI